MKVSSGTGRVALNRRRLIGLLQVVAGVVALVLLLRGHWPLGGDRSVGEHPAPEPELPMDPALAQLYHQPENDLPLPFSRGEGDSAPLLALAPLGERWTGDLDALVQRRLIRALVVYSRTYFFLDGVVQRGLAYEAMSRFETWLNQQYGKRHARIHVLMIPITTEQLIPALLAGAGDIAIANLTDVASRRELVDFSRPVMENVSEIVVTGADAPAIESLDDLSGTQVFVRESSSYFQSLLALNQRFEAAGKAPVELVRVNRYLEDEDLLEMVDAGMVPTIVVDRHIAELWARALHNIALHEDVVLRSGGTIAWAMRKDSPRLKAALDRFIGRHGRGTTFGNIMRDRYLRSDRYVKNPLSLAARPWLRESMDYFKLYGERYGFDWTLIAAQAYQESGIDQSQRSRTGAVGVMQVLRSTAADRNVGIRQIDKLENNIHAGVKYLRFITDYYLSDAAIDDFNRVLLALAGYNAGPGRLRQLRREAGAAGLDPNVWFDNVEVIAARRVGSEPVQYVANILKYWVAFELSLPRQPLAGLVSDDGGGR